MYQIMIADDEITLREGLIHFIDWKSLDCEIAYAAPDGHSAIKYLEHNIVDIIITDIRMPGKSGLDLAQYVKEHKLPIKIIILSGYPDFHYAQKALRLGVADFILKDSPLDKIEDVVKKIIQQLKLDHLTTEKLELMQQSLTEEKEELRIKFFLDLIHDVPFTPEVLAQKQKLFCSGGTDLYCLLLQIRNMGQSDKIADAYSNAIIRFIENIYKPCLPTIFPLQSDTLCLILQNTTPLPEHPFAVTFRKLFAMTDHFQDYSLKIAVSAHHHSIYELNKAYLECCYCLKHHAGDGKKILFFQDEPNADHSTQNPIVQKAIRYMEANCHTTLVLSDIAAYVALNPSYLSRLFKKETGESITGYLTRCRIEKAKKLLEDETMRLSEIAESTGFHDVSYFSNTFKKMTGFTPSDYRTINTLLPDHYS